MTALIPTSQPTGVEAYEDMFKEITRKLYGDESAHGLYPHNTQVAQVAQLASGAPAAPEGGERSFTTLVSDRSLTQIDYETTTVTDQQQQQGSSNQQPQQQQQHTGGPFKSEDHLTTAFGLAALMQNGFPPPGAILNPVNFPVGAVKQTSTNIVTTNNDDRWQQQQQQQQPAQTQDQPSTDQTWSGGKHSSTASYSQKSFKKPKVEPVDISPTSVNGVSNTLNIPQTGSDKKGNFGSAAIGAATGKRYSCSSCPYTTDRRDLFTRHENIHKEEKPFHCYACLKQFNRADHVKKHFLRMHRDMEYEIAKTRRAVSTKSYYNNGSSSSNSTPVSTPATQPATTQPQAIQASTLNIPTAAFPSQITIPTHHSTIEHSAAGLSAATHDITTLNGAIHHVQHHSQLQQQQQQQQQAQQPSQIVVAPPIIAIKEEKGSAIISNNTHDSSSNAIDEKPFVKKIKGEKRFTCCYCPWSGADNWGLKRHLNTHTKPFVCMLCDYKAARSERLATHVFKVHNKKACNKCNFFAEDQDQLNVHQQEAHLLNMQAIGRNKASVTQDFHNAGGGNHSHVSNGSSNSNGAIAYYGASITNKLSLLAAASSSASCSPSPSPPAVCATKQPQQQQQSTGHSAIQTPPVSLTEEHHLSLLQLLATAAVARQHQQQKATSTTSINSPPASHPQPQQLQQQPYHHQNSTNSSAGDGSVAPHALPVNGSKRRRKSSSRNDKENLNLVPHQLATLGKVIDLTTGGGAPGEHGIERNNNSSSNNNNSSVNNKNINETIFDRMYKKPYNMYLASAFCKPTLEKEPRAKDDSKENFSLVEFLRNHKEVSISTLPNGLNSTANAKVSNKASCDAGDDSNDRSPNDTDAEVMFVREEKRLGRKQQLPRKLDVEPGDSPVKPRPDANEIADIRDKHMIRLVTRRLCCRTCQNQHRLEHLNNCHYHSKTSLILHNYWRHGGRLSKQRERCKWCSEQFMHKYKLVLHEKLHHRTLKSRTLPRKVAAVPKLAKKDAGKKQKRKQRKRKPKSRCFTKRRK